MQISDTKLIVTPTIHISFPTDASLFIQCYEERCRLPSVTMRVYQDCQGNQTGCGTIDRLCIKYLAVSLLSVTMQDMRSSRLPHDLRSVLDVEL